MEDYEDTGMSPQQIQDRLDRICEGCPVGACMRNFAGEKWIRDV